MVDKRWFEQYQNGVAHVIDPSQYSSIVAVLKESCHKYSEKVAYSNLGTDMTYAELDRSYS